MKAYIKERVAAVVERMLANHLMGLPAVNDQGEFVGAVLLHDLEKADANEAIEAHAVEGTPYVTPGRVGGNGQVEDAVGVRCERRQIRGRVDHT